MRSTRKLMKPLAWRRREISRVLALEVKALRADLIAARLQRSVASPNTEPRLDSAEPGRAE